MTKLVFSGEDDRRCEEMRNYYFNGKIRQQENSFEATKYRKTLWRWDHIRKYDGGEQE